MSTTAKTGTDAGRDLQEFEAKVLDAAAKATPEEQQAAKAIVDATDITSVVEVTPITAALLFVELNKHNRDFSLGKAHGYAQQMTLGYWHLVHQGLAFYPTKKLADGQHRLAATFLSGTTQRFTVFRGFEEDAMQAIDIGKRRTAGDAFGLTNLVDKDVAKLAASIVDCVMKYEHRRLHAKTIAPSIYEMEAWAKLHRTHLNIAIGIADRVAKGDPVLSKADTGSVALNMLLGGYATEVTEDYLAAVHQSVGRYPDSPTIDLHRQFLKSKERGAKGRLSKEEKLALAFKGAELFVLNRTTGGLRWKAGKEPLPAPTPPAAQSQAA